MGREGVKLFRAKGWRVGAVVRNPGGLALPGQHLGGERLWTRPVDVTDKDAFDAAVADSCAGNLHAGLHMMWNNAGIGASGWFEDVPCEAAMRVVDVNFKSVLTGAYAALPYLKKSTASLLFSTSSSATYGMPPQLAVYSATKHAVKGLTGALSVEWQRHGGAGRRRAARSDRYCDPDVDAVPLRGRCPHTLRGGDPGHRAQERHVSLDAGQQRRRGGVAGLPPPQPVALGCIGMCRKALGGSIGSKASARVRPAGASSNRCPRCSATAVSETCRELQRHGGG
jgi:hypothetical protein